MLCLSVVLACSLSSNPLHMVQHIESHCNTTYKALHCCIHTAGHHSRLPRPPNHVHTPVPGLYPLSNKGRAPPIDQAAHKTESLVHATAAATHVCVHPFSHSNCMAVAATPTKPSAHSTPLPLNLQMMNVVPCTLIDSLCDDNENCELAHRSKRTKA